MVYSIFTQQDDQFNITGLFWYLVKRDLSSVRYRTARKVQSDQFYMVVQSDQLYMVTLYWPGIVGQVRWMAVIS